MLYVTTRSNEDTFTSNHALLENRAPDGGLYVPLHMPSFFPAEIDELKEKSMGQRIADVLNPLFGTRLDGWDVDFCIGRAPVRLVPVTRRVFLAESWHNPDWNFDWMVNCLIEQIGQQEDGQKPVSDWFYIAVRSAVLFGIFGELMKEGIADRNKPVDVSVPSGDFSAAMAAWYARSWGLPIGNIVCCCNENSAPWDLIHMGELRTNSIAARTSAPDCDQIIPRDLERLVFACGGYEESLRFVQAVRKGGMYCSNDGAARNIRKGMFVSVVSGKRMESTIPNVYKTTSKILGPYTALAYSGLLDYRAKTGESRCAIVLSEKSPVYDSETVASAMGISVSELEKIMNTR